MAENYTRALNGADLLQIARNVGLREVMFNVSAERATPLLQAFFAEAMATLRQQAGRVDGEACRQAFREEDGYGEDRLGTRDYRVFRDGFFAGARVAGTCKDGLQAETEDQLFGKSEWLGAPSAWIVRRTYSHPTAAVATLTFDEAEADDCRERGGKVTPMFTQEALTAALAQNTQGDGEAVAYRWWEGTHYAYGERPSVQHSRNTPLYLHAERARVPDNKPSRCPAHVVHPKSSAPGPRNPPLWCCLPEGHEGRHRHNGGGMYPSIPFRDTDEVSMEPAAPSQRAEVDGNA